MELLFASHHTGKLRELKTLLKDFPDIQLCSPKHYKSLVLPRCQAESSREQALFTAKAAAQQTGVYAIADITTLSVPALDTEELDALSWEEADQTHALREKLLKLAAKLQGVRRAAYLECHLAIASPSGEFTKCSSASTEGILATCERGSHGFGFDTIFLKHDYDKTFGELREEIKTRISPRRKAFDRLHPHLESLCLQSEHLMSQ